MHLLALLASFALAGYAAERLVASEPARVAVWFVGAAILHDLVLLPLYSAADTGLARSWQRRRLPAPDVTAATPSVNYLRVPLAISGLLLLVFFPSIFRLSAIYRPTTDLSSAHYLQHWLLVSGVLFCLSGFVYLLRTARGRGRRKLRGRQSPTRPDHGPSSEGGRGA